MSRGKRAQQAQSTTAVARGPASEHSDDLAKGHAAVQILEGGGLFPRITAWAAAAIEQGNHLGASEASRRWFTNRPYLRTLARSFDAGDPTVKQAQALLDDMEPFEDRLPTVLELTFAGSEQGKAAWLARIGRAPKAEPVDAKEPAATAVPAVQSPLRPENAKSGWDYVTGAVLGGAAILHGEAHRDRADPLADMINNAVDSSAFAKGFAVGGVEGAWDALKDNARIFEDINDLIVDLVKAKIAGGDLGVLYAVRDKIKALIAAGQQVPAALKAFAERWNDASDLAAQGHLQGHAVGYIAVQVLALVIGAITPGGQYADVINILKLATDPLGGLLELGTAAKAARAAKAAGKVEHAADGAVAGERAGVKAAEGTAAGERKLGGVFEKAAPPRRVLAQPEAGASRTIEATGVTRPSAPRQPETVSVAGYAQSPRLQWRKNPDGGVRSVEEAVEIARRHGVEIPDDILVRKSVGKIMADNTMAAYFSKPHAVASKTVTWDAFYMRDLDEILVRVDARVFESDEAIVAILGHEMHELNELRRIFEESGGSMTYGRLHRLISPGIKGNLHDQAWDVADELVAKMRRGGEQ